MNNKNKVVKIGPLEQRVRKRARRNAVRRGLLGVLAVGGALTVALAAPKVLSLLKNEHVDALLPQDPRQRLYETASRLKRKGLIEFTNEHGVRRMRITQAGRAYIEQTIEYRLPERPKRWDGRWRVIIFDIPEKRKNLRERIRRIVLDLGFLRLQDSVWVYPYDCEELIALIKTELHTGKSLLYMIVDAIEYDAHIRKHFNLPTHT